jgi:hypothetical protein
MSTTYTLRPVSASVSYIMTNGKKVGQIIKTDAGYIAKLGEHRETRATQRAAFDAVVLPTLGFDSVALLKAHNAQVRAKNAALHAEAREAFSGSTADMIKFIDKLV